MLKHLTTKVGLGFCNQDYKQKTAPFGAVFFVLVAFVYLNFSGLLSFEIGHP